MIYERLELTYDVDRLWAECTKIIVQYGIDATGQISLTHRPTTGEQRLRDGVGSLWGTGLKERDFSVFNEEFAETYLGEVYRALPRIGRFRIARLRGRTCYSVHRDPSPRVHLPLLTNPQALMLFPDVPFALHMPADGHVYWADTTLLHTALNGSLDDRYHLIGSVIE